MSVWVVNHGFKYGFICSASLLIVGNWIRYAGSSKSSDGIYACAMVGEILIGFAQPFVLATPAKYSDLWFTHRGRVAATALATLANPLGAALGQLINPLWVSSPKDVSQMVLYVSIIVSVSAPTSLYRTWW